MDPEKSYSGIGKLLQEYIDNTSQEAWQTIKEKIDYTFNSLDFALFPLEKETGLSREIEMRPGKGPKAPF